MKALLKIAVILLCTCISTSSFAKGNDMHGPVKVEVIRVLDGDTFDVRAQIWVGQFIETRVRLNGLDTPELRAKCDSERQAALKAKARLIELVMDKPIVLSDIKNGKYAGRVLAKANTADGTDISQYLIQNGYARPYAGKKRRGWCPS